ncbi:hypothetical protein CL659_02665 [bacterium]|nr:hypothetical protein [bacterium]|tara:strand:+ start:19072 stop:19899 length:828 start_codon:yes stop_codon:yes gene_type:complete
MIFLLALIPFSHPFWSSLPTPSVPDWKKIEERLSIASYANMGDGVYMDGEIASISEPFSFHKNGFKVTGDIYYLGGGFMDSPIDSWHDFWGLPVGDRPNMPKNQVLMSFEHDGDVLWEVRDSGFGVSPLRVSKDMENDLILKAVVFPGVGPLDLYSGPSLAVYKKYKYGKWFGEYGGGWFGGLDIETLEGTGFFAFSAFREKKVYENVLNFGIVSSTNLWTGPVNSTLEGQVTELYLSARFRINEYFFRIGFSEDLSVNRVADFNLFLEFLPTSD